LQKKNPWRKIERNVLIFKCNKLISSSLFAFFPANTLIIVDLIHFQIEIINEDFAVEHKDQISFRSKAERSRCFWKISVNTSWNGSLFGRIKLWMPECATGYGKFTWLTSAGGNQRANRLMYPTGFLIIVWMTHWMTQSCI
jgi:hypothetical protein